jgi:hypothetical protein
VRGRERVRHRDFEADLGFADAVALRSRIRAEFEPIVPTGFVPIEKKGVTEYRLNPAIVVERVDWRALQEDDDGALARTAREGARVGRVDVGTPQTVERALQVRVGGPNALALVARGRTRVPQALVRGDGQGGWRAEPSRSVAEG